MLDSTSPRLTDAIAKSKIVMAMSARSLLLEGNAVPDSLYFDLEETHPNFDGLAVHTIIALSSPRNVFIYNSLTAYRQQLVRLHVDRVDAMVREGERGGGEMWVFSGVQIFVKSL